jgi:hypothetical protein
MSRTRDRRVIDPAEATVVQRIFALYDAGEGLKRIAKQLTGERAAVPKPFQRFDKLFTGITIPRPAVVSKRG